MEWFLELDHGQGKKKTWKDGEVRWMRKETRELDEEKGKRQVAKAEKENTFDQDKQGT